MNVRKASHRGPYRVNNYSISTAQRLALMMLALTWPLGSSAEIEHQFVPADFANPSLEQLIKFPATEEPIQVIVPCAARVSMQGDIAANACFGKNNDHSVFEKAVDAAMAKAILSAASVDGRPKEVWVPYTVVFRRKDSGSLIHVFTNYGTERERYGLDYSAPQRIISRENRRPGPPEVGGSRQCDFRSAVWIQAQITAAGKPQDVVVLNKVSKRCRQDLVRVIEESDFIPAHYKGTPVPASFSEPFYSTSSTRRRR